MKKQNIISLIGVLTLICLASAGSLAVIYMVTHKRIVVQERKETEDSLARVIPDAHPEGFEKKEVQISGGRTITYYEAYDKPLPDTDKNLIGYALTGSAPGYSSTIVVMAGFDAGRKTIKGLRVLQQQETPGLGAVCQLETVEKKIWKPFAPAGRPVSWADQFTELKIENLEVLKERTEDKVEAITGATITSAAVVRAARNALSDLESAIEAQKEGAE